MRVPVATYRIQFGPGFRFDQALPILDHLARLGVTEIYASPVFKAKRGSTHGYDVVDYGEINPELGGRPMLERLASAARALGLGWIQDFVPNHMAYHPENGLLADVLEEGPASPSAPVFDIDWQHPDESLRGRVLAPFLGTFYGQALEQGDIRIVYEKGEFAADAFGLRFPMRIESYLDVFASALGGTSRDERAAAPDRDPLEEARRLADAFSPAGQSLSSKDRRRRIKDELWRLYSGRPEVRNLVDRKLVELNGTPGNPSSFDALDDILSRQHFRLSFWKVAGEEVNYRRFFGLNDLIGLRLEQPGVFEQTHALALDLLRAGTFSGLRVDHIDGLYDPKGYLDRLRTEAPDAFLVVEKVLQPDERLPEEWPVEGTTGYDWLNMVNGLFCRTENGTRLERVYSSFTGRTTVAPDLRVRTKRQVMGQNLAGDIANLALRLKRISGLHRRTRDFTAFGLRRAMVEIVAQFPVYRTYPLPGRVAEADEGRLRDAVWRAKAALPALLNEYDFILDILLLRLPAGLTDEARQECLEFVLRFQQLLAPVAAKGFEDTFLYVYNRLLSLNEVGSEPSRFGRTLEEFHAFNAERAERWPRSLNATSTHDVKRGEDVRARLNVLSELPQEWEKSVRTWRRLNRKFKRPADGGQSAPEANDEYFLYQTLAGSYPFGADERASFTGRLKACMIKAVREAKVRTAWLKPDEEYEAAVGAFVEGVLDRRENPVFLESFLDFERKLASYGVLNSLSQALLKVACPGIPDIYQGAELWDLNMVDPDNRRPVDFARRASLLVELEARAGRDKPGLIRDLWARREDGGIKLYLLSRALRGRKGRPRLFDEGRYVPLTVRGPRADHVIAFARNAGDDWAVCLASRFFAALAEPGRLPIGSAVWTNTRVVLPEGAAAAYEDVLTGRSHRVGKGLPLSAAFADLPMAFLISRA